MVEREVGVGRGRVFVVFNLVLGCYSCGCLLYLIWNWVVIAAVVVVVVVVVVYNCMLTETSKIRSSVL